MLGDPQRRTPARLSLLALFYERLTRRPREAISSLATLYNSDNYYMTTSVSMKSGGTGDSVSRKGRIAWKEKWGYIILGIFCIAALYIGIHFLLFSMQWNILKFIRCRQQRENRDTTRVYYLNNVCIYRVGIFITLSSMFLINGQYYLLVFLLKPDVLLFNSFIHSYYKKKYLPDKDVLFNHFSFQT